MNPIGFTRKDKGQLLMLDVAYLLDAMTIDDRKEFVAMVCEDEVFLHTICAAVATDEQWAKLRPEHNDHDSWWGESTKTKLRAALAPLLGAAVADELRKAIQKAELYHSAHDQFRSLCHIRSMFRDASEPIERRSRMDQLAREWFHAEKLFPEFMPEPAKESA